MASDLPVDPEEQSSSEPRTQSSTAPLPNLKSENSPPPNANPETPPTQPDTGPKKPIWCGKDDYKCGASFKEPHPKVEGDPWEKLHDVVKKHDDPMCDAWVAEIQNLLIFAGLFSAVVTAFVVETQKLLQEDPNTTSALFLATIASQLSANSTFHIPVPTTTLRPFNTQSSFQAFRINTFFFVSLVISLSTALFGILVLQWIRTYQTRDTRSYEHLVALRQSKYEGMIKWKVPEIVASLPILLQLGLVVFFVGLVDFLRLLYPALAMVVGVFVGVVILALVATTILPASSVLWSRLDATDRDSLFRDWLNRQVVCAYQSPQSWFILQSIAWIRKHIFGRWEFRAWTIVPNPNFRKHDDSLSSWQDFIASKSILRSWTPDALYWVFRNCRHTPEPFCAAYHSLLGQPAEHKAMVIHKLLNDTDISPRIDDNLLRAGWVVGKVPSEELEDDVTQYGFNPFMGELLSTQLLTIWEDETRNTFKPMYSVQALRSHHIECALRCLAELERDPSLEHFRERILEFSSLTGYTSGNIQQDQLHTFWYFCCSALMDKNRVPPSYIPWRIFWDVLLADWDKLTIITPDEVLSAIHIQLTSRRPDSDSTPMHALFMALFGGLRRGRQGLSKLLQNPSFLACIDFLEMGKVTFTLEKITLLWKETVLPSIANQSNIPEDTVLPLLSVTKVESSDGRQGKLGENPGLFDI